MVVPSAADVLEQLAQRQLLGGVHPGRRLVQRKQLRVGRQRARNLEAALVAVGEVSRQEVGVAARCRRSRAVPARVRPDRASPRACCAGCAASRRARRRCVRTCRPTITFSSAVMSANRRMFWNVRAMPASATSCGCGRPRPAVELETARVRRVQAGDHVEERGLARAVGADQAVDLRRGGSSTPTSASACRPPNRLLTPWHASSGASLRQRSAPRPWPSPRRRRQLDGRARGDGHRPSGRYSMISTIASAEQQHAQRLGRRRRRGRTGLLHRHPM